MLDYAHVGDERGGGGEPAFAGAQEEDEAVEAWAAVVDGTHEDGEGRCLPDLWMMAVDGTALCCCRSQRERKNKKSERKNKKSELAVEDYREGIGIWVVLLGVDACRMELGSREGFNSN